MSEDLRGSNRGEQDYNQTGREHFEKLTGQHAPDGEELQQMQGRLKKVPSPKAPQHALAATADPAETRDLRPGSSSDKSTRGRLPDDEEDTLRFLATLPACVAVQRYIELLRTGPLDPPITTESLRELDLPLIKNNLSLRIDVNYDHDLHFMPISGRRGEEKREEADKYWQCVVLELCSYQHAATGTCRACHGNIAVTEVSFPSRVSRMFHHIRALVLLLVPEDDHQQVQQVFDVDLLVQEIQNGVLDAGGLAMWLKALLTTHCAPIRDEKAEEMAQFITLAEQAGDMYKLAMGLEKLFSFLECMRLDVANHQISGYIPNDYELPC